MCASSSAPLASPRLSLSPTEMFLFAPFDVNTNRGHMTIRNKGTTEKTAFSIQTPRDGPFAIDLNLSSGVLGPQECATITVDVGPIHDRCFLDRINQGDQRIRVNY